MLSTYTYSESTTPISYSTNSIEIQMNKLQEENQNLKIENEMLKEKLKNLIFHTEEINKVLKSISNSHQTASTQNPNSTALLNSTKKNAYEEYENRPIRSRLTEWDWENRPVKPQSILVNYSQLNTDFQRRRSKSVCFGDKNLIHELIEIENRSNNETIPLEKVEQKEEEKAIEKRLDFSEEEVNSKKEKPTKKVKTAKSSAKPLVNKALVKPLKETRKYNLDTSSESNQDDSRNDSKNLSEKPALVPPVVSQTAQVATNKCSCNGDCLTNRCSCKKSSMGCSSKCHNGNPCKNC
ncbi:unnamed protein product [Brachionus calyciflorus]|uniref:Tesmin/TSO1-like CXC domain-containing protein n=1 Tax=Brachionus calyciflorus TaxID=104777 RepID=A0A813QGE2_9BILA|nr:unnamed protein product [Brachionus calyciflorus]